MLIYIILLAAGLFITGLGLSMIFGKESKALAQASQEVSDSVSASMKKDGKRYAAAGVVVLIASSIWFFGVRESQSKACGDETMAYVMSQRAAAKQLRSPGTAEFALMPEAKSVRTGTCKFAISSWVDAQNGFGATVRTHYVADMEYLPDSKTWRALDVKLVQ